MKYINACGVAFNHTMHDSAVKEIGRSLGVYIRASVKLTAVLHFVFLEHPCPLPFVFDAEIPAYRVEFRDSATGAVLLYIDALPTPCWEAQDIAPRAQ